MRSLQTRSLVFAQAIVLGLASVAAAQIPAGYYDGATGTGATLKSQLSTIMSTGHIQRAYGDFRFSAAITDRDPSNPNNVLLVYNRATSSSNWNPNSSSGWNREHTWPQSRQPGSASNSTRGNLGDPHALRPSNGAVNSQRGNDPFGNPTSSGTNGSVGSNYFPGDADKGDTARQLFYSATRYSGLTLVNGTPSGNQMGDLASLIVWHYADAPDAFELNRNNSIYSQALNPSYYTNNRNAYIDRPEFVWSVFVDQQNDTQLTIAGESPSADGSSSRSINLGRGYVGQPGPAPQSIGVNKAGVDGTYYRVEATGDAFTDAGDFARPIALGASPAAADSFLVGLDISTAAPGLFAGGVTIDNLDVTTDGGAGRGANDGDDLIDLSYSVLSHPVASFSNDSVLAATTIDFGQIETGSGTVFESFSLFNYGGVGAPAFAAGLDLDGLTGLGDSGVLSLNAAPFDGIEQSTALTIDAFFDTSVVGSFEATYTLNLSGEDLLGEQTQTLSLTLLGEVLGSLAGDYNSDGLVDAADYSVYRDTLGSTADLRADGNNDGEINAADLAVWSGAFGSVSGSSGAVPEPSSLLLAALAYGYFSTAARRR